ncbi:hypothetical protein MNQ98_04365 [Paenibacillus sp. N3/727]|uniref:hypothetical protein n=1 Tax=Paenibacillus sp. N3/727 TaxID=2925845 RepID=UPI001F5397D8|nr:hypothetical protein [Paenibacillus sp. N3/727]UNK19278.1 hypothetical protein MNQ98_04365 [Paenibacillus sp. N3/727]
MTTLTKKYQQKTASLYDSYDSYDSILVNLSTSKQAWFDMMKWNGINYIWIEMLDFLIQSEADLHNWNSWWSGNIDDLIANISDYRQHRIKQSHVNLTLLQFQELYQDNIKEALERLFVEPIYDCVIEKLSLAGIKSERIYELRVQGKIERLSGVFAFLGEGELA